MKIIYFSPIEWSSIKQRPQHLARYLAEKYDFYYIQPLGLRELKFSDINRIWKRIANFFELDITRKSHKVRVKNLFFFPFMMSYKLVQYLNIWLLTVQLKKYFDENTIVWVTSPTNIVPMLLSKLKYRKLIYEMLDDYVKIHSGLQCEIARTEELLIDLSDLVIVTSQLLLEKCQSISKADNHCVLVNNGVDYNFFANNVFNVPAELTVMKKIVGYIGAIDTWMDFATVEFIARQRPELDFVFIGPVKVTSLPIVPNLHFLGVKDYSILPQYLKAFSVCLIPFTAGEFADSINPVKLYEYLACGKPVISFAMREIQAFADVMYIAKNKEDFLLKLDLALEENNQDVVSKRLIVASKNDWQIRAQVLDRLLVELSS